MNYDMFDEIDYFTNLSNTNDNNMITNNNMNNNITNNNQNINSNLFNPYEGFIKGNLFKNLYDSYKNLKPVNIKINNEFDEMLMNVSELSFARHELNLLLDVYPNDQNVLNLFNRYLKMEKKARENYERRFGPLEVTSDNQTNTPFMWVKDKWPWEM